MKPTSNNIRFNFLKLPEKLRNIAYLAEHSQGNGHSIIFLMHKHLNIALLKFNSPVFHFENDTKKANKKAKKLLKNVLYDESTQTIALKVLRNHALCKTERKSLKVIRVEYREWLEEHYTTLYKKFINRTKYLEKTKIFESREKAYIEAIVMYVEKSKYPILFN